MEETIQHKSDSKRYLVKTFGCQMNEHDSERIAGQLNSLGFVEAQGEEDADIILLNTCAIRDTAEQKIYGEIGRLKQLKDKKPSLILGVSGCMPHEEVTIKRLKAQAPHVDIVFGTHNIPELPSILKKATAADEMVVDVWQESKELREHLPTKRRSGFKAWVTIIYGCDKFCTYCIVPYTRGREKSRKPEDIVDEIRELGNQGYKEITLLGQNVNSYGKDLEGYTFANLLRDVDKIDNIRWVRYMTSHPRDFTDDMVDAIANSEKIVEHFHLPVQSGSNEILRRMNRRYTREQYLDLVKQIKEKVPNAAITTDIIVGFPGETDEDFQQTLELVKEVQYDNAYTFIYSPREGTVAAKWEDPIDPETKKERLNQLMELQYEISLKHNKELVGKELEVLIEGESKKTKGILSTRTRTNKLVLVPGDPTLTGKFGRVRVTEAQTWILKGELINVED